jgi:hypothetical protein
LAAPAARELGDIAMSAPGRTSRSLPGQDLLFAGVALVLLVLAVHGPLKDNLHQGIRWFYDRIDLGIYAERGAWLPSGARPYVDVFSEYPQLATYFFALPYVLLGMPRQGDAVAGYQVVFSLLMAGMLLAAFRLVQDLVPERKRVAWILLLPASLYFTINRYDVLPAFLSVLSFWALARGKYRTSALLLALGVLAKWYLLVLFPIFAQYQLRKTGRRPYAMTAVFVATGLCAIGVTLLHSGIDGLIVPYAFHMGRAMNGESLFYLTSQAVRFLTGVNIGGPVAYAVLLLLQFSGGILSLLHRIDSMRKVALWSALSIVLFMLFAKFYSPQWLLWLMPFLVLAWSGRRAVYLAVALDLASYAYFPFIFDLQSPGRRVLMPAIIGIKTILLLAIAVMLAVEARAPARTTATRTG